MELRRHVRFPADHVIQVCAYRGDLEENETSRMMDVSESGLCYVGKRYLAPGTKVRIEFAGCKVLSEVRHCKMREYAATIEFITGVELERILEGQTTWKELTQA
jgi:PilZ domain